MSLKRINIQNYRTSTNILYDDLELTFQCFGQPLCSKPLILVHHALTGNSDVASEQSGWWNRLIGYNKLIDLEEYAVVCIDILGNGFNEECPQLLNPKDFNISDIATLNWLLLDKLQVNQFYACIGGSIGGGVAWEMVAQRPNAFKYLIPIATHWKATDWIIGHNYIQSQLLEKTNGLELARMMAMMFYRTPASFEDKFHSKPCSNHTFQVNSWLNHHGERLKSRYKKESYKMMNHLLATLDITNKRGSFNRIVQSISSTIIQVGISSDLYFSVEDNRKTKTILDRLDIENYYFEIDSIHGHDAFLIEYEQLEQFLSPFFKQKKTSNENN